jgi:hypothetical protein
VAKRAIFPSTMVARTRQTDVTAHASIKSFSGQGNAGELQLKGTFLRHKNDAVAAVCVFVVQIPHVFNLQITVI